MDKFTWKMIVNPLYWVAFLLYIGKQARKRTYNGLFPGLITVPLGLAFSVAALITTKSLVGETLGVGWYGWLPAALISSWVVGSFLWPFAYSVADILGDLLSHVTKGLATGVFVPIANGIRHLPGSKLLWSKCDEGEGKRKWFTTLALGGAVAIGTLAAGYVGYLFTLLMKDLLAPTLVGSGIIGTIFGNGWILAGFAGFVVARLVWQPVYDTLEKGEVQGLSVLVSGVAAYFAATVLGTDLVTQLAYGAGAFVVTAAWGLPAVLIFFNEGLKKFALWIRPLVKAVYDADKNDFRLLFHHTVNVAVAAGLTYGAYVLGVKLDWANWLTYGFAGVTLVSTYLGVVHTLKHNGGNAIVGFLSSVAAGFAAYGVYGDHLGYLGWLGGVIAAVLGAAAWGLLVLPLLYRGLELTVGKVLTSAGGGLDKLHEGIYQQVKSLYKAVFEKAQDATFNDKTDFKPLFGQLSNVAFAAFVFWTSYAYGLPAIESSVGYWLSLTAAGLVTLTSYLVGGKLAKHDGGEPLIVLLCVGAALWVGGAAFSVLAWAWYWSLAASVVLGIIGGYALGLFIIPPAYTLVKTIVNAIPDKEKDGWKAGIAKLFAAIHNGAYTVVDTILLKPLSAAIERIAAIFAPIIVRVSRAYRAITARIDAIFNRKKSV